MIRTTAFARRYKNKLCVIDLKMCARVAAGALNFKLSSNPQKDAPVGEKSDQGK
jgi:hypothetical protein